MKINTKIAAYQQILRKWSSSQSDRRFYLQIYIIRIIRPNLCFLNQKLQKAAENQSEKENTPQMFKSFQKENIQKRHQTATFKHISFPDNGKFNNEQEMQFEQTKIKQSAIDKVNSLQFQSDQEKCRSLVNCLLREYDLLHPSAQKSFFQGDESVRKQVQAQKSVVYIHDQDRIDQSEKSNLISQIETSNVKLKSNIIFLELENKKLQLKLKILQKKYQQQQIQKRKEDNMDLEQRKRQKELLALQLVQLRQIKQLSFQLQVLNEFLYLQNHDKPSKKTANRLCKLKKLFKTLEIKQKRQKIIDFVTKL